ncbi:MAG: hypothetical protein LW878_04485 [Proteobacteria bacterium]|jgi:hypothetical protein|nr:hypothetical protein [Pseudomonadota bacterium]
MKLTSSLLVLTTTLLSLPSFAAITGASLYGKLIRASDQTPKQRVSLFTKHYKFSPKAIDDVYVSMDGVWTRALNIQTKNGTVKFQLSDNRPGLEFSTFESRNILSTHAYREVEVVRWQEGRSWAPEFGAAVIPDANSRTGWVNAVYQPPRDGRIVYNRVVERETERYVTTGFFHAHVSPLRPKQLRVSIAHKVEEEVIVPGSSERTSRGVEADFRREMVTRTLYGADLQIPQNRTVVYTEVQQTGPNQGYVLVVTDKGSEKLEGAVHELSFNDHSLQVAQNPIRGSIVSIERSVLGLDLPQRSSAGRGRASRTIEE